MTDLPALLGGPPVFPAGPPDWPPPWPEVRDALAACDWGKYHGPQVAGLETELAAHFGVPHALTCASGTLAVEVALRAVGVGPGSEVILAAYEYESNFLTVHALGAVPVLVDVSPVDANLDPARLEAAITPATKAILCSHLHGGLVPMRRVMAIADARKIPVVEDCAQCPGATVEGRLAGTWGHVGTLSFGGSKLLSAGRGGGLVFHDERAYHRAKAWLRRGVQEWAPLSEMQAAVVRPQLRAIEGQTRQRAEAVQQLAVAFTGLPLVPFPVALPDSVPGYYKLGCHFDAAAFGFSRERFCQAMRAEGVAFDPGFKPLHVSRSPSRYRAAGDLTHATAAGESVVILHHPILLGTPDDMANVVRAVAKVYRNADRLRT